MACPRCCVKIALPCQTCRSQGKSAKSTIRRNNSFISCVNCIFPSVFRCCRWNSADAWYRSQIVRNQQNFPREALSGNVDIPVFFIQSKCANSFGRLACCKRDTFLVSWRFSSRCSIRERRCLALSQVQVPFCTYYNRRPIFEIETFKTTLFKLLRLSLRHRR